MITTDKTDRSTRYRILDKSISFTENYQSTNLEGNPIYDVVYVSIVSNASIMVYDPNNGIDYGADLQYKRWRLSGATTGLVSSEAHNIYARLSNSDNNLVGNIIFSLNNYNTDGSITKLDEEGNPVKDENNNVVYEKDASDSHYYIKIGTLTALTNLSGQPNRTLTFDPGQLGTQKDNNEKGQELLSKMFDLVMDNPERIKPLLWFNELKVRFESIFDSIANFYKGFRIGVDENAKEITSVAVASDAPSNEDNDKAIATPSYVKAFSEARYLRYDVTEPQSVSGAVTFEKDIVVNHNQDVLGSQSVGTLQTVGGDQIIGGGVSISSNKSPGNMALVVGDYIEQGDIVQGAAITREGIASFARVKTPSMQVYELAYNRKTAVQGEFVFSDGDTVESVTYICSDGTEWTHEQVEEGLFTPYADEGMTPNFQYIRLGLSVPYEGYTTTMKEYDILYANINNIGASGSSAATGKCFMRVLATDSEEIPGVKGVSDDGTVLKVYHYQSDPDIVPGGMNMLPSPHMTITRHGNENSKKYPERQDMFLISGEDGRIAQLTGVDSPIVKHDTAYGIVLGRLPHNLIKYVKSAGYSYLNEDHPYLYARGAIVQDLIRIDYKGKVIKTQNYRGIWNADIAASEDNYYDANDISYDTVTHNGSLWQCDKSKTTEEPRGGINDWLLLIAKGDDGTSIKVKGSFDTYDSFIEEWQDEDGVWIAPEDSSDCYIVRQDLYVWDGSGWYNAGQFKGDKGDKGDAGQDGVSPMVNLLDNTSFEDLNEDGTLAKWTFAASANMFSIVDKKESGIGSNAILCVKNISTGLTQQMRQKVPTSLSAGAVYTLSLYAKSLTGSELNCAVYANGSVDIYNVYHNSEKLSSSSVKWVFAVGTEWEKHYFTFRTKDDETLDMMPEIRLGGFGTSTNGDSYMFAQVKLEYANDQTELSKAVPSAWSLSTDDVTGTDGTNGVNGAFKSIVFKRSLLPLTKASTPTGGTYDSPYPTLEDGSIDDSWSDGIPDGEGAVYSSFRMFFGDDSVETHWSEPKLMADNADFEVMYSARAFASIDAAKGSIPTDTFDNSETWWELANTAGWYDDETEVSDPIWMATISRKSGAQWADSKWTVSKIKGEDGDDAGATYTIIPSVDTIYIDNENYMTAENISLTIGETTPHGYAEITEYSELTKKGLRVKYRVDSSSSYIEVTSLNDVFPSSPAGYKDVTFKLVGSNDEKTHAIRTIAIVRQGDSGVGIDSVTTEYAVTTDFKQPDVNSENVWSDVFPTNINEGEYLWCKTVTDYTDKEKEDTITITVSKFGKSGTSVKVVGTYYGVNSSPTDYSSITNWQKATTEGKLPVEVKEGQYLWTKVEFSDGSINYTTSYSGKSLTIESIRYAVTTTNTRPSDDKFTLEEAPSEVKQGEYVWTKTTYSDGNFDYGVANVAKDGNGINSVTISYGTSTSASVKPKTWQSDMPVVEEGEYLWTRTITDYTDDSVGDTVTYTYAYQGMTGQAGETPIFADLDNEMDSVPLTSDGKSYDNPSAIVTNVWVSKGVNNISIQKIKVNGVELTTSYKDVGQNFTCEYSDSDNNVRSLSFVPKTGVVIAERSSFPIALTYNVDENSPSTSNLNFTINGVRASKDGVSPTIYNLVTSTNQVKVDKNGNPSVSKITCKVTKTEGGAFYDNVTSGVSVKYYVNGGSTEYDYKLGGTGVDTSSFASELKLVLLVGGKEYESETIYKVYDGSDGDSVTIVSIEYQEGSSPTTPPTGTWSKTVVDVAEGNYLWTRTTFSNKDVAYGVSRQAKDGDDGKSAITFHAEPAIVNVQVDAQDKKLINNTTKMIKVYARDPWGLLAAGVDYVISTPMAINLTFGTPSIIDNKYQFTLNIKDSITGAGIPKSFAINFTSKDGKTDLGTLSISIAISERGLAGPQGEAGAMLIPQGNWAPDVFYKLEKRSDGSVSGKPVVYFLEAGAEDGSYFVLEKDMDENIFVEENMNGTLVKFPAYISGLEKIKITTSNTDYWSPFEKVDYIYTNAIMANWAKLGGNNGAVFYDKYLFSQKGTDKDGNEVYYDKDSIVEGEFSQNFKPNLSLDFLNGKLTGKEVDISGSFHDGTFDNITATNIKVSKATLDDVSINNAAITDVTIKGSMFSAFTDQYMNSLSDDNSGSSSDPDLFAKTNCVFVNGIPDWGTPSSTAEKIVGIPFDSKYNGFRAVVINEAIDVNARDSNTHAVSLIGEINTELKQGFYENGTRANSLKLKPREGIELLGFGYRNNFFGWIVLNRFWYRSRSEGYEQKVIFRGCINNDLTVAKARNFDGSTPVCLPAPSYTNGVRVLFRGANTFSQDYMVLVSGLGGTVTLMEKGTNYFDISRSKETIGFDYIVINTEDRYTPYKAYDSAWS